MTLPPAELVFIRSAALSGATPFEISQACNNLWHGQQTALNASNIDAITRQSVVHKKAVDTTNRKRKLMTGCY
jgi:hypothetical protein